MKATTFRKSELAIDCKLHRWLVNNKVFGCVSSDVCYHGKTRFEIDEIA